MYLERDNWRGLGSEVGFHNCLGVVSKCEMSEMSVLWGLGLRRRGRGS